MEGPGSPFWLSTAVLLFFFFYDLKNLCHVSKGHGYIYCKKDRFVMPLLPFWRRGLQYSTKQIIWKKKFEKIEQINQIKYCNRWDKKSAKKVGQIVFDFLGQDLFSKDFFTKENHHYLLLIARVQVWLLRCWSLFQVLLSMRWKHLLQGKSILIQTWALSETVEKPCLLVLCSWGISKCSARLFWNANHIKGVYHLFQPLLV